MRKKYLAINVYFMQNFLVDLFVTNHSRQARPYALFYAHIDSYRILYNLDSHRNRHLQRGTRRFIGIFFNKSLGPFAFGKMTFCHDKIKPNGENYRGNRDKTIKGHCVYG